MLNFIKKQWKKETFHFWGILIVILIFSYFLGEYLLDAIDGLVSGETKTFTPLAFGFFSLCAIGVVILYFIIIKLLNYYKIINKKYKKQSNTVVNMFLSKIILFFTFAVITDFYPEHTIEWIKKQESGLVLNFKKYDNIKSYYSSFTSTDGEGIIVAIGYQVECNNGQKFYLKNFFDRKLVDNKEGIYCKKGVLCKDNVYKLDENGNKIQKISIYKHSTKKEIFIDFNEKEKYFNKLCN